MLELLIVPLVLGFMIVVVIAEAIQRVRKVWDVVRRKRA